MLLDNKNIIKSVTSFNNSIRYTTGDIFIYPGKSDDLDNPPKIYRVNSLDPGSQSGVSSFGDRVYTSMTPDEDKIKNPESPLYTLYAEPVTETIAGIQYFTGAKNFNNGMEFRQLLGSNSCSLVTVPGEMANYLCSSDQKFDSDRNYVILSRNHGQQVFTISVTGELAMVNKYTHDYPLDESEGTSITLADFSTIGDVKPFILSPETQIIDNRSNSGIVEYDIHDEDGTHQISIEEDGSNECVVSVTGDLTSVNLIKVVVQYDFNDGRPSYQEILPIYIKVNESSMATDGMFCKLTYSRVNESKFTVTATKVESTGDSIPNMRSIEIKSIIGLKRL